VKRNKTKISDILKLITKVILALLVAGLFSLLIYFSFKWCQYNDLFAINSIYITGNNITDDNEILKICQELYNKNIFSINEKAIQRKLEKLPYIYAACISKFLPSSLVVRIYERKPLSFVKLKQLYVADENFTLLPLPEANRSLSLPVINYQLTPVPKINQMDKINDTNILSALNIVKSAKYEFKSLYNHISEVVITNEGFSIITTDRGIPIYLGKDNLKHKLRILLKFQETIGDSRTYTQFHYIDLRWKKQVIVGSSRKRG